MTVTPEVGADHLTIARKAGVDLVSLRFWT